MMKIAGITVAYNEDYQIAAFKRHYQQYRGQLYRHVIVDNGSRPEYVARLRLEFPDSTVVTRSENGGTTAAFNDGIRCALDDPKVEGILLVVQDVQLDPMFLPSLSSLLSGDSTIAAVGGVVFSAGTEDQVESYGGAVDWNRFTMRPNYSGESGTDRLPDSLDVDFIPGGVSLAKRGAYEKVGLQDEALFMYCDEMDWTFRAKQRGYRLVVSKAARAWHQHRFVGTVRRGEARANFYTFRNRVYLIGKHHGRREMRRYSAAAAWLLGKSVISRAPHGHLVGAVAAAQFLGLLYGVINLMGRRLYANG